MPMDCYDAGLLLAEPEQVAQPGPELAEHVASCPSCDELRASLAGETELVPPADELIGTEIGPYKIASVIGSGGMGRVYRAVHSQIETNVAIKVLSNQAIESDHLVSRFFAEARAAGVIKHENIVNVLDVGRLDDGRPYLIMEHLLGEPLSALVRTPRLTDAMTRALALDVLAALEAAHAIDIVHRDLKPDNIFVSPEGRATLLDFGIAKLVPTTAGAQTRTITGQILGTPHYMAPEQAAGEAVDARADIYAMGVILYECTTGHRPFEGSSFYRLASEHHHRAPVPPTRWRDDLDSDFEAVILKALAKQPDDRFESAAAMRTALSECQGSEVSGGFSVEEGVRRAAKTQTAETVRARPASKAEGARRPLLVAALGAAAVIAIVVVAIGLFGNRSPRPGLAPAADAAPEKIAARPLDAAVAKPAPIIDAAVAIDAAPEPKPVIKRPQGSRPLARVAEATRKALAIEADAVLTRIEISAISDAGRIRWGGKSEVKMFFYSPSLAAKYKEKRPGKISRCGIKAIWRGKGLEVDRAYLRCDRLRPLPPPRCSLAEVMRRARAAKKLPDGIAPESATLTMSRNRRSQPLWKFVYKGVNYGSSSC